MSSSELKVLALLIVLISGGAAFWHYYDDLVPSDEVVVITPPVESVPEPIPEPTGPRHPVEPLQTPETDDTEELPPLDDSDVSFLTALVVTLGTGVENLMVNEALVDRFVATVDNLPRKQVPEKIRPVGRLVPQFSATATADDATFVLGPENFARYDALVSLLANADVDALATLYRRYYPLFQESYERLGYPHDYFNDRVVEVIDHLLLTPEPQGPVLLVRPHVLFQFTDPKLEALSSGQKLLLRIGNEHSSRVKQVLEAMRPLLVSQQG